MKNDNFKLLNDKELLRLTGIKQNTFNKMLDWQPFLGHFLYGLLFYKFNRC